MSLAKANFVAVNPPADDIWSISDFGLLIADAFNLPQQLIEPVLYNDMNYEVSRPNEMSLSNHKICKELGIQKNSLSIDRSISNLLLGQQNFIQGIR